MTSIDNKADDAPMYFRKDSPRFSEVERLIPYGEKLGISPVYSQKTVYFIMHEKFISPKIALILLQSEKDYRIWQEYRDDLNWKDKRSPLGLIYSV